MRECDVGEGVEKLILLESVDNMNSEKAMREIIEWAKKKDNTIRYERALDILYNTDCSITEEEVENILEKVRANNIDIIRDADEEYENGNANIDNVIPADVRIAQRTLNIYNLMERLLNKEVDLSPAFQRKKNLWTVQQQSRLIESLMLKIPIPTFYFNAAEDDKWMVIDGLQRLSAFNNYLVGNEDENGNLIKLPLTGLQYMKDFNGLTFDELPRQYVRRIKETQIVAYTVEKGTPDAIVYNIFQRINTGGLQLNPQEIRHALYAGRATKLLEKLAESEEFRKATQYSIDTDRMADCEYVNRFIAFTELELAEYHGNVDEFLRKALKKVNDYSDEDIMRVEQSFLRVMKYCFNIFEKYAFRKYNESWRRGPINKALFESWSYVLSRLTDDELNELVEKRQELLKKFQIMLQNMDYINAIKSGDQYSVTRRIDMTKSIVKEIL